MIIKAISEQISIATANTVDSAKLVYVFNANTTAPTTITVANTTANTGSLRISSNQGMLIEKLSTETIQGATCFATKVGFRN